MATNPALESSMTSTRLDSIIPIEESSESKRLGQEGVSSSKDNTSDARDATTETVTNVADAAPEKQVLFDRVPEGGLAGWSTVLGAFLVQFCGFGYISTGFMNNFVAYSQFDLERYTSSFGVWQDFYTRFFITNESSSTISWIGGINAFTTIMGGLLAGKLFDKGYFLVCAGALLEAFCLFMLSLAKPDQFYQVFLSQGIGAGLAAGMMYVPSVAVVSHYFRKRRALAMTIVASGSSLGSIIHPIMLNNLFFRIGFANTARANAGLISGVLLIACSLMRTRLPPNASPIGLREAVVKFSKDSAYVWATAGMMIFSIGYYFPLFYIQLDASVHGLNPTFVFYTLVILNSASFVGRLTPGLVANKLGVANIFTTGMGACSILLFGMIGVKTVPGFVVIAILYGYAAGIYMALAIPLLASFAENQAELGARMGIGFAFSGIGALVAGPIEGALVTGRYIWWRPAVFCGLVTFCGFCCMSVMMVLLHQRKRHRAAAGLSADAEKA